MEVNCCTVNNQKNKNKNIQNLRFELNFKSLLQYLDYAVYLLLNILLKTSCNLPCLNDLVRITLLYVLYHSLFPKLGITTHFLKTLKNILNEKSWEICCFQYYLLIAYLQTKVVNLMEKKKKKEVEKKKINVVPVAISQILQSL